MNKTIVMLLTMIMIFSLSSCGTQSSQNSSETTESVQTESVQKEATAIIPEYIGKYSLGKSKAENQHVKTPTTLYNKPLSGVELTYNDNTNELWLISYDFSEGVTLSIVLDAIINDIGSYSDYQQIETTGQVAYMQDSYYWSFEDHYIELRYREYPTGSKILKLFVCDK